MRHFNGPIWDELYGKYGQVTFKPVPPPMPTRETITTAFKKYIDRCTRRLELWMIYPPKSDVRVPEITEMSRIGVEGAEGIRALVKMCAERKDVDMLERIVTPYFKGHFEYLIRVSRREIIQDLYDAHFYDGLVQLTKNKTFAAVSALLTMISPEVNTKIRTCCLNSVLYHGTTNMLGQAVCHYGSICPKPRMDILRYLLSIGCAPTPRGQDTPLAMSLFAKCGCLVMQLLAEHNADFSLSSDRNVLGIPDAIFMAIFYNPNLIPFILITGGLCLTIPSAVQGPSNPAKYLLKRPLVCCELGRYRGMLQIMSEFSLILPLCINCKKSSGLESGIPSLMSICRMTYRSQFPSSRLLAHEIPLPECYAEYLTFRRENTLDRKEFLAAVFERNPLIYVPYRNYLLPGENYDIEEVDQKPENVAVAENKTTVYDRIYKNEVLRLKSEY